MLMNRYGFFFQAAIKLGTLPAYKAGWAAAITRHRNHPSIFDWCMGNEGWGKMVISRFACCPSR